MAQQKETLGFQTEVKQLLHLMIHSLYSNKEIFLRELISNASDACDKLRFEALNNGDLYENDSELQLKITLDKDAGTISIHDNGIGLSREEAITNLGTIAKSGTREFFQNLSGDSQKDASLIGQFGVGFYSSFIVAEKVTVVSRRAGLSAEHGIRWESNGDGEFTIEEINNPQRGTVVTLYLREGMSDFSSSWKIREIIKKYSDHISLPIYMYKEEWDEKEQKSVIRDELETVNQAKALWTRAKSEISNEEYNEFYKHVAHDYEDPLSWSHSKVEGTQEYTQLLYLPKRAPFDLWDRNARHGIKLYVRRIFIMDDAEQLMPNYLRFIRGVVDSSDLPLNVSREILQESKDIEAMRNGCTRKVLAMLEDLAANKIEDYKIFWKEFGKVLKEGLSEDHNNKDKIAKLLRFASTLSDNDNEGVTLDDYIARMKPDQEKIYYITAESFNAAKNSPHLEIFRKKGIEVLLMFDRVDEWVVSSLPEYGEKKLQSVAKGDLDLGKLDDEKDKEESKKATDENKELLDKMKASLGEKVEEVRITHRLTESPACLVSQQWGMSANLARILESTGQKAPNIKPVLEINPVHPVVQRLKYEQQRFDDWVLVLFEQAQLAEGAQLDDPGGFVKRVNQLMLEMSGK